MKKLILTLALTEAGRDNKISAIKQLRAASGLGLKEAKEVVDALQEAQDNAKRVVMFADQVALLLLVAPPPLFGGTPAPTCFYCREEITVYEEPEVLDITSKLHTCEPGFYMRTSEPGFYQRAA